MKELTLAEIKEIEISILKKIHDICVKNNIRYSLVGGTLLGAIRHRGFIPWDDDIDIMMPRPDYELFKNYCKNNKVDFLLVTNDEESGYGYLFAKACDPKTILKESIGNRKNIELGVHVDVFPVDGIGNSINEANKNFNKRRFERELLVAANWKKYVRSKSRAWYYEPIRAVFYIISRPITFSFLIKRIEKYYKDIDFEESKYACSVFGAYRMKETFEKTMYTSFIEVEFEGNKFNVFENYDEYLTQIYGNYMELPPLDKRVTHHTFKAYYK